MASRAVDVPVSCSSSEASSSTLTVVASIVPIGEYSASLPEGVTRDRRPSGVSGDEKRGSRLRWLLLGELIGLLGELELRVLVERTSS